jgi:hypothetical protein
MSIDHPTRQLGDAIQGVLRASEFFNRYPLEARSRFLRINVWLPDHERSIPVELLDAARAKRLRDKAGRELGWRLANHLVVLLKDAIEREISLGFISQNRVRNVAKLPPPRQQSNYRRPIRPVRHQISASTDPSICEKSSG